MINIYFNGLLNITQLLVMVWDLPVPGGPYRRMLGTLTPFFANSCTVVKNPASRQRSCSAAQPSSWRRARKNRPRSGLPGVGAGGSDMVCAALGVDVARTRFLAFFAASAAVGVAVAFTGLVGFVGLVVPHAVRLVAGPDHRVVLPASALGGAAFLVLADALARLLFRGLGAEPPVGAVTALIGAPLFVVLLRSRR